MNSPGAERRQHPRVHAPVLYRRAGSGSVYDRRTPEDVSLGGMKVQSAEPVEPGSLLDVEVLLPDQWLVICSAEVVWMATKPDTPRSTHLVGLKFVNMTGEDQRRLLAVLAQP